MGNAARPNELHRNDGGGSFTAVSNFSSGLISDLAWTSAVAWGDMDGDGDLVRQQCSPNALLCTCSHKHRPARVRELGLVRCAGLDLVMEWTKN